MAANTGSKLVDRSVGQKIAIVTGVFLPFLGCVIAASLLWRFGWMGWLYVALLLVGWVITGMGITVGFHRLLSHRAFETHRWTRAFWTILGAIAAQGPPFIWCATHRKHHELSDQPGDPHSPHLHGDGWFSGVRGFVHSHFGWFMQYGANRDVVRRYVPDLIKDPLLVHVDRFYPIYIAFGLALPAVIGGLVTSSWFGALLGFLWGGLVRIFMVHHITWSINSVCHVFGSQTYRSEDQSRNNLICGILGHGEGWHNNHHAFPTSARHGLQWWQFDLSWLTILAMRTVGLAWNVRTPSSDALQAKLLDSSGGSEPSVETASAETAPGETAPGAKQSDTVKRPRRPARESSSSKAI